MWAPHRDQGEGRYYLDHPGQLFKYGTVLIDVETSIRRCGFGVWAPHCKQVSTATETSTETVYREI